MGKRIADVDALRGFALLGIFVVNITFMASGFTNALVPDPNHQHWYDDVAHFASYIFVDTKFYLLFSFLFGYSLTLLAGPSPQLPRAKILRRLVGLMVLGIAHMVLLYTGDILFTYGLFGLLLLAMWKLSPRAAVIVGIAITLLMGGSAILAGLLAPAPPPGDPEAALRATELLQGGFGDVIAAHLHLLPVQVIVIVAQGPLCLATFLFGMAAGRRRLLETTTEAVWRRVQVIGFPVGLAGALVFAIGGGSLGTNPVTAGISLLTAPFLTAAYVATLMRMFAAGSRLRAVLAPAGRMALTNYLTQSLVGVVLFTGIGFGLVGELSTPALLAVAVLVFGAQLPLSRWWLTRFRYGPVEWLLRAFTNLEVPQWRSPAEPARDVEPEPVGRSDPA